MSRMEGFFEALSRIPGLTFMEKYAKNIRTARYTVRSGRERAEELSERGKLVKEKAGMKGAKKGGKAGKGDAAAGGKPTARDLRAKTRRREEQSLEPSPGPKPIRRQRAPELDEKPAVRDTSPERDHGRSLRKRKDSI